MIWNILERVAVLLDRWQQPIVICLGLAVVGTCYHIRTDKTAHKRQHETLHAPRPDPFIVCPTCATRFMCWEAADIDLDAIQWYNERASTNPQDAEPRW